MKEEWREVTDFPNYLVSNMGRIMAKPRIRVMEKPDCTLHYKSKILKPKINKRDRCSRVELWNNGEHKTVLVHRIVANEFIAPYMHTDLTVNHKDGNRQNNCVDNLEWLTNGDNTRHGFDNGFYSTNVRCELIAPNGEHHEFRSMAQASFFLGRSESYVAIAVREGRKIKDINGNIYLFNKL